MDIRACLCEINFNLVSKNLINDSDEFAGTVTKDIVMSSPLRHLVIVVSLEGELFLITLCAAFIRYSEGL